MLMRTYMLSPDGTPIPCADVVTWGRWLENQDRTVAKSMLGDHWVSTVFLALDHRFGADGPPLLWETMIFDADRNAIYCERHSSHADAMAGHELACEWLQAKLA